MKKEIWEAAYGGLLHDIGKPYQRSFYKSNLTETEEFVLPVHPKGGYRTHLHAGYTSRFLKEILHLPDAFEYAVSSHHLKESGTALHDIVQKADWIASAIDRQDEAKDFDTSNSRSAFQIMRMSSVMEEVNFGKPAYPGLIQLETIQDAAYPDPETKTALDKTSAVQEYDDFFGRFIQEVQADSKLMGKTDRAAFSRMYGLLYQYMTSVPASTYGVSKTFVSLFDHLKLTSAIAACLAAQPKETFRMLEFDISGIQKFIFKVTEGSDTKPKIAKALRGRSLLISLITDWITFSFLNAFEMPESCIIFNTGGGAMLLLPDADDFDKKVNALNESLLQQLHQLFHTDITFVAASVICDAKELETFRTDKAIELKAKLDQEKRRKFLPLMNESFFIEKAEGDHVCPMCGNVFTQNASCEVCTLIERISEFFVRHPKPLLLFSFQSVDLLTTAPGFEILKSGTEQLSWRMGGGEITLCTQEQMEKKGLCWDYAESINHSCLGVTRYIACQVPMNPFREIMPLNEICELADVTEWGDPKLGILKMDVDNLGAVFAYGMNGDPNDLVKARSLSKFLALSRMLELFFGKELPRICQEVSDLVNEEISEKTSNDTMFYIDYAGGDDLVIFGPAAGILELADTINREFNDYTLNDNLTISAGIVIQRPSQPVRFGILEAEKMLSAAKERLPEKNGCGLLNVVMPFSEFSNVLDGAHQWKQNIQTDKGKPVSFSRTGFYQMMKLLNVKDMNTYAQRVPLALYSIQRNVKTREFREDLIQRISQLCRPGRTDRKEMEQLQKLILEMKLTIMQTRQ